MEGGKIPRVSAALYDDENDARFCWIGTFVFGRAAIRVYGHIIA